MSSHIKPYWQKLMMIVFLPLIISLLSACPQSPPSKPEPTKPAATNTSDVEEPKLKLPACTSVNVLDLNCVAPPDTFKLPANHADWGSYWDIWSWNSFAAMNWPARQAKKQATGYLRGFPDGNNSFLKAQGSDVTVWETFKEKREIFNSTVTDSPSEWQSITFPEDQVPQEWGGSLPMCQGTSPYDLKKVSRHRILAQSTKASIHGDNTLDETAEVASQARETAAVLCQGYTTTTKPTLSQCTNTLFPDSNLAGRPPVGPRVWKGTPSNNRPVLYEVKLNYDYFNYIVGNKYNDDKTAYTASRTADIRLPYRTSSQNAPLNSMKKPSTANPNRVVNYQSSTAAKALLNPGTATTPPKYGAIQIKTGWLLLEDEDASQYHTSYAVYFKSVSESNPEDICYAVGQFGLLGIHIIQRVHAGASGSANASATGGTFIFSTWEHNSLESSDYQYANYLSGTNSILTTKEEINSTPFPNINISGSSGIAVTRMHPILSTTVKVNQNAQSLLKKSGSVWQYYQLIGTQFVGVSSESDSAGYNQPYYLANLVIETNDDLQNFQGLPPKTTPIKHYRGNGIKRTTNQFERDFNNLRFGGTSYNMGGCMGCHGVAQLNGYSFSFVLQNGQRGTELDTQHSFSIPPDPPSPKN